jgi:hypothetical protein
LDESFSTAVASCQPGIMAICQALDEIFLGAVYMGQRRYQISFARDVTPQRWTSEATSYRGANAANGKSLGRNSPRMWGEPCSNIVALDKPPPPTVGRIARGPMWNVSVFLVLASFHFTPCIFREFVYGRTICILRD